MSGLAGEAKRAYEREYHLARYHRLRREAIVNLGGRCSRCGSTQDLQIDHIDPTSKSFDIAKLWSVNKKRREAELRKCQILCEDCHRQKSIHERFGERQHGTYTMYRRGKCRCPECVEAQRAYMREYMRKRRNQGAVL